MENNKKPKIITPYLLSCVLLLLISEGLFITEGKGEDRAPEDCPAEHLFRHLMDQTRLAQSPRKGCLAFGNPLYNPSRPFLDRFRDLKDRLVGLEQIEGKGKQSGFHDGQTGLPVIVYQISRIVTFGPNCWLMEGGWFSSRAHSRKCLYHVALNGSGCRIREIRTMDRCRHVITCHDGHAGRRFSARRIAF
jgi:hypothetical protein